MERMNPALEHLPRGWFHHGEQILALLEQHQPKVIVELGTFLGASAIGMARVARSWQGTVYCVDTWAGNPSTKRYLRSPLRLFQCAANLIIADVAPSIRLIPAKTVDAAKHWHGPAIDCLYVDADHSIEGVMADLSGWVPHVRSGGLVMGDDYDNPLCPGVNAAWDAFEKEQGIPLTRVLTPDTNPPGMSLVYGVKP